MKSEAYRNGVFAYRNFGSEAENPYNVDECWDDYLEWENGWFDACLDEDE